MWVLKAVPEVDQKLDSGSLSLTTLSQAQVFFRQENKVRKETVAQMAFAPEAKRELLSALENKSTREVDRELIGRATEPLKLKKKDRVRAVSATMSELKCLVSDETLEDLEKLKGLLVHKHPHLSMGELLALIAKAALKELDPTKEPKRKRRLSATPAPEATSPEVTSAAARTRYVPAEVRREVWKLANRKCQTCRSIYRLQIDHIQPHALGGSSQLENLRLLCFHCNQREADQELGRARMATHRKPVARMLSLPSRRANLRPG